MRREQLGELVSLTSQMPVLRRTAEMPVVELNDLLRKDREIDVPDVSDVPVVTAEHFDTSARCETSTRPYPLQSPRLAIGTVRIFRPSSVRLALGCIAAFAGGFALTLPLWW